MESTPYGYLCHGAGTQLSCHIGSPVRIGVPARNDAFAGRVGVGQPHVTFGTLACDAGPLVVYARQHEHDARVLLGSLLHGFALFGHEPNGFFKPDGPSSDQGRVLPEAVPGACGRLDTEPFDSVQDDEAQDEGGQCVPSLASSSALASRSRLSTSRPTTPDASCTTSQDGWFRQARPMPGRWDPCPGKTNVGNCADLLGLLSFDLASLTKVQAGELSASTSVTLAWDHAGLSPAGLLISRAAASRAGYPYFSSSARTATPVRPVTQVLAIAVT